MGCQNYGPFLGTLDSRCRTIMGTQKRDHSFDNHPYNVQGIVIVPRIGYLEFSV